MNKIVGSLCAAVLICTGCFLTGERPTISRTIALGFGETEAERKGNLSTNEAPVQKALRIIEDVLVSDGFGPNTNRMDGNENGFIVGYAKYTADGMRRVTGPDVYLKSGRLEVVFTELGNRSTHFSSATQKVFDSVRKELSNHFGSRRVKVVKPPGG